MTVAEAQLILIIFAREGARIALPGENQKPDAVLDALADIVILSMQENDRTELLERVARCSQGKDSIDLSTLEF